MSRTFMGHRWIILCFLSLLLAPLLLNGQDENLTLDPDGVDESLILRYIHESKLDSAERITRLYLDYVRNNDPTLLPEAHFLRTMGHMANFEYQAAVDQANLGLKEDPSDFLIETKLRKAKANAHKYLGNLDSALVQVEKVLERESEVDRAELAEIYYAQYSIQTQLGNDDKALESLYRALDLFEEVEDYSFAASIRSYIGVIYHHLDEDSLALDYQDQALDYFLSHDELDNASYVYLERANMYIDMERYQEAADDLLRVVEISDANGHVANKANSLSLLGTAYLNLGKQQEAIDSYMESLAICTEYGIPIGIASCKMDIAKLYLKTEEPDSALRYAQDLHDICVQEGFMDYLPGAKKILSEAYAMNGLHEKAYTMKLEESELRDSIFSLEKSETIGKLREQFEREKNLREVERLKNEAQLDALKRRGLIIGLIVAALLFFLIINREVKRRKKAKELHLAEMKLSETERQRLADQLAFKNRELTSNALNMAHKNEFLTAMGERLDSIARSDDPQKEIRGLRTDLKVEGQMESNWDQFISLFTETNPTFYKELTERYPDLSKGELRMAALLRMNLGNKDIARMLNISDDGVKKSRYRLRKKLGLQPDDSLESLILSI
ncbi:MAG: tetratricopeptide repeat protein [Flavobacteriales bacterium]|nr:tetratricopeptide repeat protein [Flavobacteriales bacterium]